MPVEGLDALDRKFKRMSTDARAKIEQELERSANEVAALARGLAPVERGDLKKSIRSERGPKPLQWLVKAGGQPAFYARWVEFGRPGVAARPFFFTAYRALRTKIRARIGRTIGAAARAQAKSEVSNT